MTARSIRFEPEGFNCRDITLRNRNFKMVARCLFEVNLEIFRVLVQNFCVDERGKKKLYRIVA